MKVVETQRGTRCKKTNRKRIREGSLWSAKLTGDPAQREKAGSQPLFTKRDP